MKTIIYIGRNSCTLRGKTFEAGYKVSASPLKLVKIPNKGEYFSGAMICPEELQKAFPDLCLKRGESVKLTLEYTVE